MMHGEISLLKDCKNGVALLTSSRREYYIIFFRSPHMGLFSVQI